MPIYEGRRPKTWRVVIWAQGKSNEWIVEGRRKDAESFEARKKVELDAGKKLSPRASPSFSEFCQTVYAPHAIKHLKNSTWNKVRVYQIATLCQHFGKLRLSAITLETKNGLPREVPISRALRVVLEQPKRNERWVFPTRLGSRYAEFPKDLFGEIRAAAKLTGGPHTLRHSFASAFLSKVPDMFLLAQVLGHSHQRITELYSHLLPDHLSRAKDAVDIGPAAAPNETMAEPWREETRH